MTNEKGYIKIYRSLLDWEWWSDDNVLKLYIYILLSANWRDKRWQGQEIKRGEFVTSIDKLSAGTNLTKSQVRTALDKLKSSGEVIAKSQQGKRYTIISVCKFDEYQESQSDSNEIAMKSQTNRNEIANKSQTNRNEIATTKEKKEREEIKEREEEEEKKEVKRKKSTRKKPVRHKYGEYQHVKLSDDELDKLKQEYGTAMVDDCITLLDEYCEEKGKRYESGYLTIKRWVIDAVNEKKSKQTKTSNNLSWIDNIKI